MKKKLLPLILLLILSSCGISKKIKSDNVQVSFLDDFIIPEDLEIGGTRVGGLSGIDYHDGEYYLVADHPGNPRFYKAEIRIKEQQIDTIIISEVVQLDRGSSVFLKENTLDLEAIRFDPEENEFILTSEGSVKNGKDPSFFHLNPTGEYISQYELPNYFKASGEQKPRNNGVFEGLAKSYDKKGFWVGMELPLVKDGSKPKLFPTKSPIRITYFSKKGEATKQFIMQLEGITKIPWLYFAVNGLTEILEYNPERFLVLERAFSAGHGSNGNTVRIFDVDARNTTNTLKAENLRKIDYTAAKKTLIFDFKSIKKRLKQQIIDNLEGMTFGPDLPNGNKTLLLVSDNNFNSLGKQVSQVILMELTLKN